MTAFITGPAGSGKSTELMHRANGAAQHAAVLVTSPSPASLRALQAAPAHAAIAFRDLSAVAIGLLGDAELIDDVRAVALFERAAEPLLTLSWTEFVEAEIDPEVPGLRAPERFLEAAFRLFCKLRDARISPETFLESALRGAAQFYAKPPNFAHTDLIYYTKDQHRDSLEADEAELARQYRRELDLAKILAKLYRTYLDHPVRAGCLTARDAIAQAAALLEAEPERARTFRGRYPAAFVDDAQELTLGELELLQAMYGEQLEGVTLAGDPDSATSAFHGARPDRVFALAGERTALALQHRTPAAVDAACRHLLGSAPAPARASADGAAALKLFRASTPRAEAQFVADHTIELLSAGAAHDDIAILFRSVAAVRPYRDALLERNVRVQVAGDLNLFTEPEALDALAVLWTLYDPYRHEYLLRVLSGPACALSDASVYTLCGEPSDTQTLLFAGGDAAAGARSGRWDSKRDVRLAWNVLSGDRDRDLSPQARERVVLLRERRARWLDAMRELSLPALARLVWSEGLARAGEPGSAAAAYQQLTLSRLHARIAGFAHRHPGAALGEFLEDAHERMESSFAAAEYSETAGAVRILSIDAARGREFAHIILPNVRAGSFPRWYAPDAFLYSPTMGMIAKENVGDGRAARTAKFSYYMYRTKAREAYNREERRAFVYAMRRARESVLVTASERATRGVTAPEFLSELQAARLPGTADLSDRWRPARTVYTG